jgi:hypothetical protein
LHFEPFCQRKLNKIKKIKPFKDIGACSWCHWKALDEWGFLEGDFIIFKPNMREM